MTAPCVERARVDRHLQRRGVADGDAPRGVGRDHKRDGVPERGPDFERGNGWIDRFARVLENCQHDAGRRRCQHTVSVADPRRLQPRLRRGGLCARGLHIAARTGDIGSSLLEGALKIRSGRGDFSIRGTLIGFVARELRARSARILARDNAGGE